MHCRATSVTTWMEIMLEKIYNRLMQDFKSFLFNVCHEGFQVTLK